jgi:hypothetical protein
MCHNECTCKFTVVTMRVISTAVFARHHPLKELSSRKHCRSGMVVMNDLNYTLLMCRLSQSSAYHMTSACNIVRRVSNPAKSKVNVILRPTFIRPVCPGVRHPFGDHGQILITAWKLRVWWCETSSLTRGQVCSLLLLLGCSRQVILGSESRRTHDHILLSKIWRSPNLED